MSDSGWDLVRHYSEELAKSIKIGDKIRFSVELVEQMREMPDHRTQILVVEKIERDADGTKNIWMKNDDAGTIQQT